MRVLLAVAVLAVVATSTAGAASRQAGKARLTIAVWAQGAGEGKPVRTWTLRCRPAGGTHPSPARACRALFANLSAIRPVSAGQACRRRIAGPQEATLRGSLQGRRVRAAFNRRGTCQIARWQRLGALFPLARTPAEQPTTDLRMTVFPEGPDGPSYVTTLTCDPAGGTHPAPARACNALMDVRAPFAPPESDRACTMIWGGPQVAGVQGLFRGEQVVTRFNRSDGCQIERWDRVAFLFAPPS
jgi:hypothetical protein